MLTCSRIASRKNAAQLTHATQLGVRDRSYRKLKQRIGSALRKEYGFSLWVSHLQHQRNTNLQLLARE